MSTKRNFNEVFDLEKEARLIDKIKNTVKEIELYDEMMLKEEIGSSLFAPTPLFAPGMPCIYTMQETFNDDIEKYMDKLNAISPKLWHFDWGTLRLLQYNTKKIKYCL